MEITKVLKEQLRNTNLQLNNIYEEQQDLIEKYIKEKKKLFVTDLITTDKNGNYELKGNIEDIDYFLVEYEGINTKGEDEIMLVKVIGIEYNEEFGDINIFYVDKYNETELLCGNFDYLFNTSYRKIVNMILTYGD